MNTRQWQAFILSPWSIIHPHMTALWKLWMPISKPSFEQPPILVVMGVSGTGKSTLARALGDRFGGTFIEGDDVHPQANLEKMSAGIALDDDDRAGWLKAVATQMSDLPRDRFTVVTCSALKIIYRSVLANASSRVGFVCLTAEEGMLLDRVQGRIDAGEHFMPASLLQSQLDTFEKPSQEEVPNGLIFLPASVPTSEQVRRIGEMWSL